MLQLGHNVMSMTFEQRGADARCTCTLSVHCPLRFLSLYYLCICYILYSVVPLPLPLPFPLCTSCLAYALFIYPASEVCDLQGAISIIPAPGLRAGIQY
jgi:hypothetical protein